MPYTLAMDLGDLIVFGGVILSVIGSAVAAARKKKLQAARLGADSGSTAAAGGPGPEATSLPRTRRRRSPPPAAPPPVASPLAAPDMAEAPADPGPEGGTRPGQVHGGFDLRAAVIAQTILGPPRGLEAWREQG